MSLSKAIKSGKERRQEYHGCKSYDKSCRNHGGCAWCENNRTYRNRRESDKYKIKDKYEQGTLESD